MTQESTSSDPAMISAVEHVAAAGHQLVALAAQPDHQADGRGQREEQEPDVGQRRERHLAVEDTS